MDGILFKAVPPISKAGFHIPASPVVFSQMITSFTCKEKLSKLKLSLIPDNRASGGAAMFLVYSQVYAFIVAAARLEGSTESLSRGETFMQKQMKKREKASSSGSNLSALLRRCLADGGDVADDPAAKVAARRYALS